MNPLDPLGELLRPRPATTAAASGPLHPYALELPLPGHPTAAPPASRDVAATGPTTRKPETGALVFTCWDNAESPNALHLALRQHIEGALLAQMSRSPKSLRDHGSLTLTQIWLLSFASHPLPQEALRAFALQNIGLPNQNGVQRNLVQRLRGEAQANGREAPDDATGIFETRVAHNAVAEQVHLVMLNLAGDARWGERPGAFFKLLSRAVASVTNDAPLEASAQAASQLEALLCPKDNGVLRWLPPLVLQGLCDLTGLIAAQRGRDVAWSVPQPRPTGDDASNHSDGAEDDDDAASPPLLRLDGDDSPLHLPVGQEILRWCVMPKQPGEEIPPLGDWMQDATG